MGAAISLMPGASALRVPRTRFLPVKRCEDLLVIQSDVYQQTHSSRLVMNSKRVSPALRQAPAVSLDSNCPGPYLRMVSCTR